MNITSNNKSPITNWGFGLTPLLYGLSFYEVMEIISNSNDAFLTSMIDTKDARMYKIVGFAMMLCLLGVMSRPAMAQTTEVDTGLQSLRSDVGIIGLTANIHSLAKFDYINQDSSFVAPESDGSTELEFVLRDIRMLSPRIGVGFQVLTSFFVNDAEGEPGFGIGSWGLGPSVRAYPFETDRFQPYVQANALFGNNMNVGKSANTNGGGEFRARMGLRAGIAFRVNNSLGFFVEAGPDWESSRIFDPTVRTLQLNFGIDLYRFK